MEVVTRDTEILPKPPDTHSFDATAHAVSGFSDTLLAEECTPASNLKDRNFFAESPVIATCNIPLNKIIGVGTVEPNVSVRQKRLMEVLES